MASSDQVRWDRRHREGVGSQTPSRFLQEIIDGDHWKIARGRALDLASGRGRNALFLAFRGFQVTAMDISPVGLERARKLAEERALTVDWQQADLESLPLSAGTYDLIVNINYLQRSLIPRLKAALKTGGHAVFETYLIDQRAAGHPKNPAYLLNHNELLDHFRDCRVLSYHEGLFADGGEASFRAGILARKPS